MGSEGGNQKLEFNMVKKQSNWKNQRDCDMIRVINMEMAGGRGNQSYDFNYAGRYLELSLQLKEAIPQSLATWICLITFSNEKHWAF